MTYVDGIRRHYKRFRKGDAETRLFLIRRRYIPELVSAALAPVRLVLAVILRVALQLLRPLVHIRFGRCPTHSIGAWGIPMELYLCQKDLGMHPKRSLDLFFHHNNVRHMIKNPGRIQDQACNKQLETMLNRKVRMLQFASTLDGLNRMLPNGSSLFTVPDTSYYDPWGMFQKTPAHLEFTEEEEQFGMAELARLGIEPRVPFVCFNVRDGDFIVQNIPKMAALYGEWDTQPWRNATMSNYIDATDHLSSLGSYVVRMGKHSKEPMNHSNPRVIDYAYQHHSDFLDVYLSARCRFFIGQNSGMIHLPSIFRTPMVLVNILPFEDIVDTACPDTIFIPKKYYSAKKGRLLTYREILADPRLYHYVGPWVDEEYYNDIGLELWENTAEEITAAAQEMEERLNGTFEPTAEQTILQQRFIALVDAHREGLPPLDDFSSIIIGSHFLESNRELFE